jgi:hypothetical protein
MSRSPRSPSAQLPPETTTVGWLTTGCCWVTVWLEELAAGVTVWLEELAAGVTVWLDEGVTVALEVVCVVWSLLLTVARGADVALSLCVTGACRFTAGLVRAGVDTTSGTTLPARRSVVRVAACPSGDCAITSTSAAVPTSAAAVSERLVRVRRRSAASRACCARVRILPPNAR